MRLAEGEGAGVLKTFRPPDDVVNSTPVSLIQFM